jgi:hypothetical protein
MGAIADYRPVAGSTCSVANDAGAIVPFASMTWDSSTGHLIDGPVPQINRSTGLIFDPPSSKRVRSWKGATSLKSITDGTSNTLLAGEVSRAFAESGHAFNGDFTPYDWIGFRAPFCQRCDLASTDGGDSGFGGAHAGVVQFVMCDGSVRSISRDTDLNVLDRFATRAGDDLADLNGVAPTCP